VRRAEHLYRGVKLMSVCLEFCVLSGKGLCYRLIICTEESYGYLSLVGVVCCHVQVSATG